MSARPEVSSVPVVGAMVSVRRGVEPARVIPWWGWSIALAIVALAQQLVVLTGVFDDGGVPAGLGPMAVTTIVAVVWLAVAVAVRVEQPVITLAAAGALHGGVTVALGAAPASLVAASDVGLTQPTGMLAILATDIAFGALLGVTALVITRNRPAVTAH